MMKQKIHIVTIICLAVLTLLGLGACTLKNHHAELSYPLKDTLQSVPFQVNTNLEVTADSVHIAVFPIDGDYYTLYKGQHVVVAETDNPQQDSIDNCHWVKIAHSEEVQGWVSAEDIRQSFIPTSPISYFIHLFSDFHVLCFMIVLLCFIIVWLGYVLMKRKYLCVLYHRIISPYPLLLCLVMSVSATLYEYMQMHTPMIWEQYYYAPSFSPFGYSPILSIFLCSIWLLLPLGYASLDDIFRKLPFMNALFYTLSLGVLCILCYLFFIVASHWYIGYFLLALFAVYIFKEVFFYALKPQYHCGKCNAIIDRKGKCPHCGADNQ